jgi:hypothetical protein
MKDLYPRSTPVSFADTLSPGEGIGCVPYLKVLYKLKFKVWFIDSKKSAWYNFLRNLKKKRG